MVSLFDSVRGCVLTIQGLHSSVPFSTPSDALFASMCIKYDRLPTSLFDDLLSLFHHTEFCAKDVTVQTWEDISDHIAEGRRSNVSNREKKQIQRCQQSADCPVPRLFVDLVAEQLESQRSRFHHSLISKYTFCEAEHALQQMSLVHSSWTAAAQRMIRRRVCVPRSGLRSLLISTQLGPWVRELYFRPSTRTRMDIRRGIDKDKDINLVRFLCDILKRCPNTTHLHLDDFYPNYWEASISAKCLAARDVAQQLGKMLSLEHLWVYLPRRRSNVKLWDVCLILPYLRCLKSLSVKNLSGPDVDEIRDMTRLMEESCPSHTLKALSLLHIPFADKCSLSWLTHPRANYTLDTLELELLHPLARNPPVHVAELQNTVSYLSPALPYITKLRVDEYKSTPKNFISSMLSLHTLCVTVAASESLPSLVLPASTRVLQVHCVGELADDFASRIHDVITASPCIRRLIVSFPENFQGMNNLHTDAGDNNRDVTLLFPRTNEYCIRHNVDFEVKILPGGPIFFDL